MCAISFYHFCKSISFSSQSSGSLACERIDYDQPFAMFYPRRREDEGNGFPCLSSKHVSWFESHKFMSLDGLGQVSLDPFSYGCQEQTSAEIAPKESCAHILWGSYLSSLRRCQLGRQVLECIVHPWLHPSNLSNIFQLNSDCPFLMKQDFGRTSQSGVTSHNSTSCRTAGIGMFALRSTLHSTTA